MTVDGCLFFCPKIVGKHMCAGTHVCGHSHDTVLQTLVSEESCLTTWVEFGFVKFHIHALHARGRKDDSDRSLCFNVSPCTKSQ